MQRPLGCEIHPPLSMQIWDSGIVQVVRWGVRRAGSVLTSNLISEAAWDCTASYLRCFLCEKRSFRHTLNLRVVVVCISS